MISVKHTPHGPTASLTPPHTDPDIATIRVSPPGHALTLSGTLPHPNGTIIAPKGTNYLDTTTGRRWRKTSTALFSLDRFGTPNLSTGWEPLTQDGTIDHTYVHTNQPQLETPNEPSSASPRNDRNRHPQDYWS